MCYRTKQPQPHTRAQCTQSPWLSAKSTLNMPCIVHSNSAQLAEIDRPTNVLRCCCLCWRLRQIRTHLHCGRGRSTDSVLCRYARTQVSAMRSSFQRLYRLMHTFMRHRRFSCFALLFVIAFAINMLGQFIHEYHACNDIQIYLCWANV